MKTGLIYKLIALCIFLASCSANDDGFTVKGDLRFAGNNEYFFEIPPVHYKYAPKQRFHPEIAADGSFSVHIPVEEEQVIWFHAAGDLYPVLAAPGQRISISADMREFLRSAKISGFGEAENQLYRKFLKEEYKLKKELKGIRGDFTDGGALEYLNIQMLRKKLAKEYFGDTALEALMYRRNGEYLISVLESVRFTEIMDQRYAERKREWVLNKAHDLHFFSYESLKAQRAGIRDFANAFAATFGFHERMEERYGQSLTANDVNHLAYAQIDSAKTLILDYIYEINAMAHAEVYLIAERLAEGPFEKAVDDYHRFRSQFAGFTEYVGFLEQHYEQLEKVQPGQLALDISYPDADGNLVSISDFEGSYVLLGYWATWCPNCRFQEPYLISLYEKYSDLNFEIVSVSIDEDKTAWDTELADTGKDWVHIYAGQGFTEESFLAYRAGSIPHYVLIDPDGNIIRNNDFRPSFNLPDILEDIFADKQVALVN